MLTREQLHIYQRHGVKHVKDHAYSGLFYEMGLGKTITTLTALTDLMQKGETGKILVVAPLRVARDSWDAEAKEWSHTRDLVFSKVIGTAKQRKEALLKKADIYLINRENVSWLVAFYGGGWPFQTVVIDELSSFKSTKAIRFRSLRQVRPLIKRVIGLTGTPAPNGMIDLWPQLYLLDRGERLGKTVTGYREKYFIPLRQNGHVVYEYGFKKPDADLFSPDHYEKEIYNKIGDICISMRAKDWLTLPERIDVDKEITLPEDVLKKYKEFERKKVLELIETGDGKKISAANAAGLTNKLLQFANGAVYDDERNWHEVHKAKLEALEDLIEASNGKPVLVLYVFRSDVERIKTHLGAKYGTIATMDDTNVLERWNSGRIPILLGHPASMGHGLNMQKGGNQIIHFGLNWSLELYQQAVARLDRQGQRQAVINTRLLCKGTHDVRVLRILDGKAGKQDTLMDAVRALVDEYR